MNAISVSALIAAFVTTSLSIAVLIRERRQAQHFIYAILCFTLSVRNLTYFLSEVTDAPTLKMLNVLLTVFLGPLTLHFILSIMKEVGERHLKSIFPAYIGAIFLGILALFLLNNFPIIAAILDLYAFGCVLFALALIWNSINHLDEGRIIKNWKYIFWGGVVVAATALTDFLPKTGIKFPAIGNILMVIYLYFLFQYISKGRVFEFEELMAKVVHFAVIVLTLTIIYLLLVSWVGNKSWLFVFNTGIASFVILVLFEPIKSASEKFTKKFILRGQTTLQPQIEKAVSHMIGVVDIKELSDKILSSFEQTFQSEHAILFLLDHAGFKFILRGESGEPVSQIKTILSNDELVEQLTQFPDPPLILDDLCQARAELPIGAERSKLDSLARHGEQIGVGIIYPILLDNKLLGFCGFKISAFFSHHQLALFQKITNQFAIALKQIEGYQRILQRDRLASLGEMAAGLAHEIRNPLGAIKGAAQQLLPPQEEGFIPLEVQNELLNVIVEETNRLNHVVSQFLGYARPYNQKREKASLNEVVIKTVDIVSKDLPEGVALSYNCNPYLKDIEIDPEQIRQVILNLLLNSIQSIENKGSVAIQTDIENGSQRIIITDNGCGIPEDVKGKLFIPFFTTRKGGTGLGLPICQRIIQAHSGLIDIQSEIGKGTKVTLLLPYKKNEKARNY